MGKMVMGYWDCPVCGNQGIAGNVMNCPACGRARGDVKFYMKGVAEDEIREAGETGGIEYLNEDQKQQFGKNPDWYCSFCNSLNKDNAAFCQNCGASRESSESNYFDQLKKRQEAEAAEKAAQLQPQATRQAKGSKKPLLIAAVVILAIIGIFTYLNGNKTQGNLTVTEIGWSRAIPVEQYQEFQEEGWNIPQGGTQTGSGQRIHHYDQVLSHYEDVEVQKSRRVLDHYETYYTYKDLGNGAFEQVENERPVYETEYYTETESRPVYVSVPRYATWYQYSIWRWTEVRTEKSTGRDHEAAWPELNLGENEREGSPRTEEYLFAVRDEKDAQTVWRLAEADWRNINAGDKLNITAKRTGADAWITDEKGNQIAPIERIQ